MIELTDDHQKLGIPWCLYCVGYHPDDIPTSQDLVKRSLNPQKEVWRKQQQFNQKKFLYMNRVCILCGRAYDENAKLDETYKLTAKIVKMEFDDAGIHGLDDRTIEAVVAQCRKAFLTLVQYRKELNPQVWKTMTFSGQLDIIINKALETKDKKKTTKDLVKI